VLLLIDELDSDRSPGLCPSNARVSPGQSPFMRQIRGRREFARRHDLSYRKHSREYRRPQGDTWDRHYLRRVDSRFLEVAQSECARVERKGARG
jgi:hypothetical protein